MDFLELMQQRYTTKKYNPTEKINSEKIEQLKQILQLSPSSINSQPWKFIFVENQELKKQLAEVSKHNTERVLKCSHLVVFNVVNNLEFFEKQISENLPEGAINYYKTYLKPRPEEEIKSWMKNQIYISLGVFLTACASMEIDTTPMEGIENEKYTEILGLENHFTTFAVCLGKRNSEDSNQPKFNPKKRVAMEKIITEIK